jgi:hypothetical protein
MRRMILNTVDAEDAAERRDREREEQNGERVLSREVQQLLGRIRTEIVGIRPAHDHPEAVRQNHERDGAAREDCGLEVLPVDDRR